MIFGTIGITTVYADSPTTLVTSGSSPDIAIGSDGFPVIEYFIKNTQVSTFDHLQLLHCTNIACSAFDGPVTLDSVSPTQMRTRSLAIGSDNFPVIAYHVDSGSSDEVKLVHCTTVDCSMSDTPITLDGGVNVGQGTSLAIGNDGFPVITYYAPNECCPSRLLEFVHCTTVDCSMSDMPITLTDLIGIATNTSIAIGSDGFPVISYDRGQLPDAGLTILHCTSANCSGVDPTVTLDNTNGVFTGQFSSIAIGNDGFPIITYIDEGPFEDFLKFIHCTSVDCSTFDSPITIHSSFPSTLPGSISINPHSITIGSDGFPAVSYRVCQTTEFGCISGTIEQKFLYCTSTDCSTLVSPRTIDTSGVGMTITIGSDGFPAIAASGTVKFFHCTNLSCQNFGIVPSCLPPSSDDWVIESGCSLENSATAPANVIVQNNAVLTIPLGMSLDIDFVNNFLRIKFLSGILVRAGGTIT